MNVSGATLSLRPGQGEGRQPARDHDIVLPHGVDRTAAALTIDRYQSGDAGRPFAY